MNVTADGHYLHWHIHKADGSEKTITVDRKQANSY
jgi:adenylylsulfate reductase subunit B